MTGYCTVPNVMFKKIQKSPLLFEGRWNAVSQRLMNLQHFITISVYIVVLLLKDLDQ